MPEVANVRIAGVDEAGRGPLAGPVVAAAVILDPHRPINGLADSKKLSARRRETLAEVIMSQALAVAVAVVEAMEIDRINILQATLLAMRQCVESLDPEPHLVRIDGNRAPDIDIAVETLIGGDALDPAISAASIIAKTRRDAIMLKLHEHYPVYGFDRHKGYPTAAHLVALEEHGPCPVHRRSFRPVTQLGLF
jgi:ribonuclease HII